MKTPREILLAKHQNIERKLDTVRAEALSKIVPATTVAHMKARPDRAGYWLESWIRSFRPHLAALAAVWLVIFGLHLASRETSQTSAVAAVAPSPEVLATLKEQKRLYTQLIEPAEVVQPALPERRPRSEEKQLIRIV